MQCPSGFQLRHRNPQLPVPPNKGSLAVMKNSHNFISDNKALRKNARRTLIVLWISFVMMMIEVIAGYWTGSMALLADGWHMGSHVAALLIAYLAYQLAGSESISRNFNFGGGKMIPLGGYTSAIFLGLMALVVAWESGERFLNPLDISFDEALAIAILGLVVNLVCAYILRDGDGLGAAHGAHAHSHGHGSSHGAQGHGSSTSAQNVDHNLRGAYFHVLADALTSVAAILALIAGKYFGIIWMDALIGLVSSVVIMRWTYTLVKDTGWELLDGHARGLDYQNVKKRIECEHVQIEDLHIWTIAPGVQACELVVNSEHAHGIEHFRKILADEFSLNHIVIEERTLRKF